MAIHTVLVLSQRFVTKMFPAQRLSLQWQINISAHNKRTIFFCRRLNTGNIIMSHLVRILAITFAVFRKIESYRCEKTAFMYDGWLFSQITSVILFSLHIKIHINSRIRYCEPRGSFCYCDNTSIYSV